MLDPKLREDMLGQADEDEEHNQASDSALGDEPEEDLDPSGNPKRTILITDEDGANIHAGILQESIFDNIVDINKEDPDLFSRGGNLVRVVDDIILPQTKDRINVYLQNRFLWYKYVNRGKDETPKKVKVNPLPGYIPMNVVNSPRISELPTLNSIKTIPVILPSGKIVTKKGYIPELETYLTEDYPHVEIMEFDKAKEKYLSLFVNFDMREDYSLAVAITYGLTIANRHNINGLCPPYLSNSSKQGSGKGLLYHVQYSILYGTEMPTLGLKASEEQTEKRWGQEAASGRQSWMIDNIRQGAQFDNQYFARFVTAKTISADIKYIADPLTFDNQTVLVLTGNNITLVGDSLRRCLESYILPTTDMPHTRKLPDIMREVRENRNEYISALLSIWHHAYQQGLNDYQSKETMGSYEEWFRMLSFVTNLLGLDIINKPEDVEDRYTEVEHAIIEFISIVYTEYQENSWELNDVHYIAMKATADFPDNLGVLDEHIDWKRYNSINRALGYFIGKYKNQVFQCGELKLSIEKASKRDKTWRLTIVK